MTKYQLAVTGWVQVEVEASSSEEAMEKALQETVAGELYDYEFSEVREIEQ